MTVRRGSKLNGEPINQMARIGTFSEEVVCPAEQVVKIRPDLPMTHAAIIGCCVATGIGAVVRHARVPAGSSVLVIGCGGVGLNVVQGARLAGARTIIACDLRDNKLDYARTFGATHTLNAGRDNVIERVRELTDGLGVDAAFDAIGTEPTALQAIEALAPGGHAVLVGIPAFSTRAAINPSAMVYGEKTVSGTYYGSVVPSVDFPILADLDMDKRNRPRRPDQPHLPLRPDQRRLQIAGGGRGGARRHRVRLKAWTAARRFLYKRRLAGAPR